jgi:hypothetical protein
MAEAQYSYLTTDLTTNKVLGELFPITGGVTFDRQFNQAGNITMSLAMDDSVSANEMVVGNTNPGKTSVWVYRESKVVWGGILWTRAYDSSTQQLALTGQTFDSYAARRYPRSFLGSGSIVWKPANQCGAIQELWTKMQAVKYGSIGVAPQAQDLFPAKDIRRNLTVSGQDMTQTVADIINGLTSFTDGPDYTIEFYEDGFGLPRKRLRVGNLIGRYVTTINIGGSSGRPSLIGDYPEGSVSSYTYVENAAGSANEVIVTGGQTKATKTTKSYTVFFTATRQGSLASGWPLLENAVSLDSTDGSQLSSLAQASLKNALLPQVTHATDLIGHELPEFSTYDLGDWWEVNIIDPRFPAGINFVKRVVGWSVTPPDMGGGPELVSLVYEEPAVNN